MKRGDTTETSVDVKDMVDRSGQNGRGEEKKDGGGGPGGGPSVGSCCKHLSI